jgi:hypothetical protein
MLSGVLIAAGAIGTAVHAIVAQAWEPAMWPATWFMDLQAVWRDGRYGVKTTWALTWFFELVPLAVVAVLGASVARLIEAARQPVVEEPAEGWEPLEQRSRVASGLVGALLLSGTGIFLGVVVVAPETFSPVGFIALILLIIAPFTGIGGLVMLADGALPPATHVGQVESREIVRGERGNAISHRITSGGKSFDVSAASYEDLVEGTRMRVKAAAVSGRVLALAKRRMGYRG